MIRKTPSLYLILAGLSCCAVLLCSKKAFAQTSVSPHTPSRSTASFQHGNPEEDFEVSVFVEKIISEGKKLIGKPYRYRVAKKLNLDCSGFISYIFSKFDIALPRSSSAQHIHTHPIVDPRPGDLIFFKGRNARSSRVGHVGMVVDVKDDDITMLHSSCSKGIVIEKVKSHAYYNRRYVGVGRVPELAKMLRNEKKKQEDLNRTHPVFYSPYIPGLLVPVPLPSPNTI